MATRSLVTDYIYEYNQINFLGTIFSAGIMFSLVAKIFFNFFAKKKMVLDMWTVIDLFTSGLNLFCFNVTGSASVD